MLIDAYLPVFDARERHERRVDAEPARTYAALLALDLKRSLFIRTLFALRTIPSRFRRGGAGQAFARRPFLEEALAAGWKVLEEAPGRELVAGAVTQPWLPVVRFLGLPGPEFVAFAEPGFAKIVWNVAVSPAPGGGTLASTETRVAATDEASRRKFCRYWFAFSPFIKLIRGAALRLLEEDLARGG